MATMTVHAIYTEAGALDTGDELNDLWWISTDEDGARNEYERRLQRCRHHVRSQVELIHASPSLELTDPYRYVTAWFQIGIDQSADPGTAVDALCGVAEALTDDGDGRAAFRDRHLLKAVVGTWDATGETAAEVITDDELLHCFGLC